MSENICRFIPTRDSNEGINILNFVYEKEADFKQEYLISASYSLSLATEGEGVLHTPSGEHGIKKGDMFLTFAAHPYYIENTENLKYIYISFVGLRAHALIERLSITKYSPVFSGFDYLIESWENGFNRINEQNIDLLCEGLLLQALSGVCCKKEETKYNDRANTLLLIKQYVDIYFTDSTLNLSSVSAKFSYNPKYISTSFKRMVHTNFSEYVANKRLEYATSLIESGITNVGELATMCGYADPMYFSKAFKKKYGVSPKKYLAGK